MEDKLLKILKKAKAIEPEEVFGARSRRLILAARQNQPGFLETVKIGLIENFKFGLALGLATILIIVIFGGFRYFENAAVTEAPAAGGQDLLAEVEKLDFQIQLDEAEYFTESAKEITALLKEIQRGENEN